MSPIGLPPSPGFVAGWWSLVREVLFDSLLRIVAAPPPSAFLGKVSPPYSSGYPPMAPHQGYKVFCPVSWFPWAG